MTLTGVWGPDWCLYCVHWIEKEIAIKVWKMVVCERVGGWVAKCVCVTVQLFLNYPPDCILTCLAGTTQFTDTGWIVLCIKFVSPPWSPREMKECKNSPSGWCHPPAFPQTPLKPTGLVSSTSAQLSLLPALGSHQYPNTHPKSTRLPHTHAPLQLGWMRGAGGPPPVTLFWSLNTWPWKI